MRAPLSDSFTKDSIEPARASKRSLVLAICLFAFIFGIFRIGNRNDQQDKVNAVQGILRSEYKSANSYALAKSISDLESLKILRCVMLTERNLKRTFYDTSKNGGCWKVTTLRKMLTVELEFTAVNGLTYDLSFQNALLNKSFLLEILCYLIAIIIAGSYARDLRLQRFESGLKYRLLKVESEWMLNNVRQIKHDVASPLSALKIVFQALKVSDPAAKDLVQKVFERIETIFNQLSSNARPGDYKVAPVHLASCIEEVVAEKRLSWRNDCDLILTEPVLKSELVLGEEDQLKRILSNILNNGFESLAQNRERKIQISAAMCEEMINLRIADTGLGMDEQDLSKIGQLGFSTKGSDRGLGVSHALNRIRAWGGELSYSSTEGRGTVAQITLRRV